LPGDQAGKVAGLVILLLIAVCSVTDLRFRKVPNWATYPAVLWALLLAAGKSFLGSDAAPAEGKPPPLVDALAIVGLEEALQGAVVCFVIMLFVYQLTGGGAGDVKLAVALGVLLGMERGLSALIYSYIIGAAAILIWAVWTVGPLVLLRSLGRKLGSFFLPRWVAPPSAEQQTLLQTKVPLSAFFASGALIVLFGGDFRW
jgi:prepilin peptidase CpaA